VVTPATNTPDLTVLTNAIQQGLLFYMGADDNLDAGEHDGASGLNGTDRAINGPSDGGAIPLGVAGGPAADTPPLANPTPPLFAAFGGCADGVCLDLSPGRQQLYQGNATSTTSRDVANYDGKTWDPPDCSSGSQKEEQACHDANHADMNAFRDSEAH